ncbi:outer membrane protein assembly factor BamB family protein [Halovenus halobia]|uniref:outer membrane protein assembly factor BamB family protein n=1 Tax=Halovenus halobia TaxID=3396622 RepID=UPI003F549F49
MNSRYTRREVLGALGTAAAGAAVAGSASGQQSTAESWPTFGYDRARSGHNPDGTSLDSDPGGAWQSTTATDAFRASAVVADGTVYAANLDGNLYAFDAVSGDPLDGWPVALGASSQATPTVAGGTVYVGNENGTLRAIDGTSGETQWRFDTEGAIRGAPAVHDGVVYATGGDGVVYAIDAETGAETLWEFDTGQGVSGDVAIRGGPAVTTGETVTVYVANTGGVVYAIENGEQQWEQIVESGQVQSTPVVANGSVYVGAVQSAAGFLYALDAASGQRDWQFEADGAILAAPAATSDYVYVGSRDQYLHALDPRNGDELWSFETDRQINSSPVVVDETVYVTNFSNSLYALTTDGEQRWQTETSGSVSASPVLADGRVYLGSENTGFYAVESGGSVAFVSGTQTDEEVEDSPLATPETGPYAFLALPAGALALFGLLGGGLYYLFKSEWAEQFIVDEAPIEKLYEDEEDQPEMPGFDDRKETGVWSVIVGDVIARAEESQTVAQENVIVTKHIDNALESPVTAYEIQSARDEPVRITLEEPLFEDSEALADQPLNEGWQLGETLTFEAVVEPGQTVKTMVGRPDAPDDFEALLERPGVTIEREDGETVTVPAGGEESDS